MVSTATAPARATAPTLAVPVKGVIDSLLVARDRKRHYGVEMPADDLGLHRVLDGVDVDRGARPDGAARQGADLAADRR